MNAERPSVFIVEDMQVQRLALHQALELRGFDVESAADVSAARKVIDRRQGRFDVVVLDMRLQDRLFPAVLGAHLGLEIRDKQPLWPAEFLVNSAYSEADYYRLALDLHAAVYLPKPQHSLDDVVRHVRVLALRHLMDAERPGAEWELRQVVESSASIDEARQRFCEAILRPLIGSALGAPFILLLTQGEKTESCGGTVELPNGCEESLHYLQSLVMPFGSKPFKFQAKLATGLRATIAAEDALSRLDGAWFVPLTARRDAFVSIGILPGAADESLAEDAGRLAELLSEHLGPSPIQSLMRIPDIASDVQRVAQLRSMAQICLHVGQAQVNLLNEAVEAGEINPDGERTRRLLDLAHDLSNAGDLLGSLGEMAAGEAPPDPDAGERLGPVDMAPLVASILHEVTAADDPAVPPPQVEGTCVARADRQQLEIAVKHIVRWFQDRRLDAPEFSIQVRCQAIPSGAVVTFQDASRRLDRRLREHLFSPRPQPVRAEQLDPRAPGACIPLYLAKMLVELGNGGALEDRSDDIAGDRGHRFVMRLPSSVPAQAAA